MPHEVETIGYIGRIVSAQQTYGEWTLPPYILQSVLLLVAPALFAASIYMSLGRIVLMVIGDDRLFIRRTWLTKIFVCGDVLAFMTQSTGASMLASADDQDGVDAGNNVIIAGLWIQVAFFGLFVVASAMFHMRLAKAPTQASRNRPWTKHLISLYIVSGLILVRSVMRCIEYMQGYNGYICKSRAVEIRSRCADDLSSEPRGIPLRIRCDSDAVRRHHHECHSSRRSSEIRARGRKNSKRRSSNELHLRRRTGVSVDLWGNDVIQDRSRNMFPRSRQPSHTLHHWSPGQLCK
jgi:hypothetical protein